MFVSVCALCAGAPSALELWLRGARVPEVDLVVVLYKARTRELRGRTSPRLTGSALRSSRYTGGVRCSAVLCQKANLTWSA